ncbi:MAG: hypothetical protein GX434_17025 [Peptococcaceae bacterium]|nr:hypothetical protein [Peptococcaceae bacterium]
MSTNFFNGFIVGIGSGDYYFSNHLEPILDFTNKILIVENNHLVKLSKRGISILDSAGKRKETILMEINKN